MDKLLTRNHTVLLWMGGNHPANKTDGGKDNAAKKTLAPHALAIGD